VSLTEGAWWRRRRGWGVHGGGLREQPQGLKFPTPGVVLLFGLHLASAVLHGGTFSDRHGIRQEGLIVPAESMSLGLKV